VDGVIGKKFKKLKNSFYCMFKKLIDKFVGFEWYLQFLIIVLLKNLFIFLPVMMRYGFPLEAYVDIIAPMVVDIIFVPIIKFIVEKTGVKEPVTSVAVGTSGTQYDTMFQDAVVDRK
jgi:hypothetical protein